MEPFEKLSLVMPRPSPKMEKIYAALEQGHPDATINGYTYSRFVLWGLIGNNIDYMSAPYIFCDMPYNGRYDPNNEDWDNTYWRWCYDGLHDNRKLEVPSDRFEQWNLNVSPWNMEGEHILLCPSSDTMTKFMHGITSDKWAEDTYNEIKRYTKRPIRVRYKPRAKGTSGPHVATTPLSSDFDNCFAVVVSASIVAVDALAAGIPVFSTHSFAPSAWCTNRDISNINKPQYYDREQLFYNLAYKQYSIKEMREGICYENSMRFLNNQSK